MRRGEQKGIKGFGHSITKRLASMPPISKGRGCNDLISECSSACSSRQIVRQPSGPSPTVRSFSNLPSPLSMGRALDVFDARAQDFRRCQTATAGDVRALANPQEAATGEPSSRKASRCGQQTGSSSSKCADLRVAGSIFQHACTARSTRSKIVARQQADR
jgi:hypothetical protein